MEDFRLDVAKAGASINFEPFTIIGATTEAGMLLRPFYDRFIHHFMLEDYSIDELSKIISKNCEKIQVSASASAIIDMAKRSRFTPRIANSILTFCRDYAYCTNASNRNHIGDQVVESAMNLKKIDEKGLDNNDRRYIMVLQRAKKPLGLNTIVGSTGLSRETIENQIEPYLLKLGMLDKTQKGRRLV
jgi:Holliday junction DNA helicase RuvB